MFGIDMLRTHSLSLERPWGAPLGIVCGSCVYAHVASFAFIFCPHWKDVCFAPRFREATADHVVKRPGKFNSPFRAMMPHYLTHRL
jgi:hypothetical protein